jgi:hypothetical protein
MCRRRRTDLDPFQWAECPGKGCLHVVRGVLIAEQQHAVFFQGGTSRSIHTIAAGYVDQIDAPHFDAEMGPSALNSMTLPPIPACSFLNNPS